MSTAALFAADSIAKRYGRREVLTAASFWVHAGEITAVVGRNGAGKSTLLRIAAGQLKADSGLVIFKGRRYLRPRLAALAKLGLFFLPDRSLLCPIRTVRQHFRALERMFPAVAVDEAVTTFSLDDVLERRPPTLSTGERRRVEGALAWARQPACVVADEPFRALAPQDQELLGAALRTMASRGVAIVATGHEVARLLDIANTVVWVTAGTTHLLGPPSAARDNFEFIREYLGPASPIGASEASG